MRIRKMKRIASLLLLLTLTLGAATQDIKVTTIDGIQNQALKGRMERGIAQLLSEVNRACAQERPLQLDGIDISFDKI